MTWVHFQHSMHRIWCWSLGIWLFLHLPHKWRFEIPHKDMIFMHTFRCRELKFHTRVCIEHTFSNSPQTTDVLRLAGRFAFPKPSQRKTGRTYLIYEACLIPITMTVTTNFIQWCVNQTQHFTYPTGGNLKFPTSLCAWDCLHSLQATLVCCLCTMSELQRLLHGYLHHGKRGI